MKYALILTLALLAGCGDAPVAGPVDTEPDPAPEPTWIADELTPRQLVAEYGGQTPGNPMADFTGEDDFYPFHIYWAWNPPPLFKAAVRSAAARWSSAVAETPVVPHVMTTETECVPGNGLPALKVEKGDTLRGFHLYVVNDTAPRYGGWAFGSCGTPQQNPTTGAPSNGLMGMASVFSPHRMHFVAMHEIGHLLGISSNHPRWRAGLEQDSVMKPDGSYGTFWVQTDSLANAKYVEWVERFDSTSHSMEPYPLRSLPLADRSHWHGCVTTGRHGSSDVTQYWFTTDNPRISPMTAAMLDGFVVDEAIINHVTDGYYGTFYNVYPTDRNWHRCPEVELRTIGLLTNEEDANAFDLTNDVREWAQVVKSR